VVEFIYGGDLKLDENWAPSIFDDVIEMIDIYGLEDNKDSRDLRNTVEQELCRRAMQEVGLPCS
jgi:hypothetical protein